MGQLIISSPSTRACGPRARKWRTGALAHAWIRTAQRGVHSPVCRWSLYLIAGFWQPRVFRMREKHAGTFSSHFICSTTLRALLPMNWA